MNQHDTDFITKGIIPDDAVHVQRSNIFTRHEAKPTGHPHGLPQSTTINLLERDKWSERQAEHIEALETALYALEIAHANNAFGESPFVADKRLEAIRKARSEIWHAIQIARGTQVD